MAWGDPKRVRVAVRHGGMHLGYVTTTTYPDRDITAFTEGSPYSEVAVSDLAEEHVALLQRFKHHWLIHCGTSYATTEIGGALTDAQIAELAAYALRNKDHAGAALAAALRALAERMLLPTE
jgi:hypothetical protein